MKVLDQKARSRTKFEKLSYSIKMDLMSVILPVFETFLKKYMSVIMVEICFFFTIVQIVCPKASLMNEIKDNSML